MKNIKMLLAVLLISQLSVAATPTRSELTTQLQESPAVKGLTTYAQSFYDDVTCGPVSVRSYDEDAKSFQASIFCKNKIHGIIVSIKGQVRSDNAIQLGTVDFGYSM